MLVPVLAALTPGFGAEAILAPAADEDAWHHHRITASALRERGWAPAAAEESAWHADALDRILYNPGWIAAGGPRRIATALRGRVANHQLHFDDLPTAQLVAAAWFRYLRGASCALR